MDVHSRLGIELSAASHDVQLQPPPEHLSVDIHEEVTAFAMEVAAHEDYSGQAVRRSTRRRLPERRINARWQNVDARSGDAIIFLKGVCRPFRPGLDGSYPP